jgi:CRISPR-associated protein Csb1
MSEPMFSQFSDLLQPDGPVAIIITQALVPVNEDDQIIFPPTYPMTSFKVRVHTIRDGDYRVSVELPPDSKRDKNEKNSDQRPGYNLDRFPDGTNSCEIDSPQSQANRIEPKFKDSPYRNLVPQIDIKVGDDPVNGKTVNLLDAGHRAGDAVVRMSSLAGEFHDAFLAARDGNCFTLATLAPTSLLFGVWDSRSTQVKMQRVIKAYIRASDVHERTRSAQFTPAADYVAAGAVNEGLDVGEGDSNPLSSEGMKHALATQTVGGVMLTETSKLTRTVNVNLVALRTLKGADPTRTEALQRYILGLALVAATLEPDLNLREGCNLRFKHQKDRVSFIPRRGDGTPVSFDSVAVLAFATASAVQFFEVAKIAFDQKDHAAVFETGVAEEFLGLEKKEDRDKVRQLGPLTASTLKRFKEKDPFKLIMDSLKAAKDALGKAKKGQPTKNPEALQSLCEALKLMSETSDLSADAKAQVSKLAELASEHQDSHAALKSIDTEIKGLRKSQKVGATSEGSVAEGNPAE